VLTHCAVTCSPTLYDDNLLLLPQLENIVWGGIFKSLWKKVTVLVTVIVTVVAEVGKRETEGNSD